MKLNSKQLRDIILAEVKKLHEAHTRDDKLGQAVTDLVTKAESVWENMAMDNDPSIDAVGPEVWLEQVEHAVDDLTDRVMAAINDVENNLINGEYYHG